MVLGGIMRPLSGNALGHRVNGWLYYWLASIPPPWEASRTSYSHDAKINSYRPLALSEAYEP